MRSMFLTIVAFLMLAGGARAETISVVLSPTVNLDEAGASLREAVTAYEAAVSSALPESWTPLELEKGRDQPLNGGSAFVLKQSRDGEAEIVLTNHDGARGGTFRTGVEMELGPVRVILLGCAAGGPAEILYRAKEPAALLQAPEEDNTSETEIEGHERDHTIVVTSPSPDVAEFSRLFLAGLNNGLKPGDAAFMAREKVPPGVVRATAGGASRSYVDPVNMFDDREPATSALVTLHLVRGDSSSIKALSGSGSYQSDGRTPDRPRVQASGGGAGASVTLGSPGDRFQGRLDALEASGKVHTESSTFLRVPLGGEGNLRIAGPSGTLDAWIHARPRGRMVELAIDQLSGDWSFLGAVATTVQARDGQSVMLAQNTFERSSSASSGVPILGGVPYVGSLFRNEVHTSESGTYALFATLELE
ncbi:hypothetical protein HZA57_00390 [Candidatus Poribacteria bacterium]|nr:hypothetical protein [Candidatus Poribacteria bacterium]